LGTVGLTDILVTPLAIVPAKGGEVMHAIKRSSSGYSDFGEAYFSWVATGAVKAWKKHKRMVMNLIVPVGGVRFVFRLEDTDEFRVEEIGVDRYSRLTVPPGIWFGFQGLAAPQSLVLNIASIPHDSSEEDRLESSQIKYDWN